VGIVGSEAASSAQLKGAKTVVAGIGVSEIGVGTGIDSEMVGIGGSICVDMVADMDWGVNGGYD
jgi:hypothetical protein